MKATPVVFAPVVLFLLFAERGLCVPSEAISPADPLLPVEGPQSKAQSCPDPEGCEYDYSAYRCYDSDGQRTWESGRVNFWYYDNLTVYSDYCYNSSYLVEYWCTINNTVNSTTYRCFNNNCSGGRCPL